MTQPVLLILPHLSPPANVLWFSHLLPRLLQLPLWSHSNQPRISSGTPQCALPSTSPDSPLFSPSYTPSWGRSDWIWNCAHGGRSCERIHSHRSTHQPARRPSHQWPPGMPLTLSPTLAADPGAFSYLPLAAVCPWAPCLFHNCLLLLQSWQDFANSVAL